MSGPANWARDAGRLWRERPRAGAGWLVFWLVFWFVVLLPLRWLPATLGIFFAVLHTMVGVVLLAAVLPLLWKRVRQRLLWSLRNKLVLTYLLIGLAPVVLFGTLALVVAYVAAGQFAIHLANARLQSQLDHLGGANFVDANVLQRRLRDGLTVQPNGSEADTQGYLETGLRDNESNFLPTLEIFHNGQEVPIDLKRGRRSIPSGRDRTPLGAPPWLEQMGTAAFQGMVQEGNALYLVAVRRVSSGSNEAYEVISSLPIDRAMMDEAARGLGRAGFSPAALQAENSRVKGQGETTSGRQKSRKVLRSQREQDEDIRTSSVFGGLEPPPVNWVDLRVRFLSTLPSVDWDTGTKQEVTIEVDSRPSRLYRQLFGESLGGIVTEVVRIGLLVLCVLFAVIEAVALWMAVRLSRTVTISVAELYRATQRIDHGDFSHQIDVERDDQMAELCRSFNTMTGSLRRLLEEQKRSQRLQNEVAIAQEVQANLFPRTTVSLPTLELHGVCRPARGVSGDYYDFLLYGGAGGRGAEERGDVGIALGDISGKGISAALLMATLHSAVRAYRVAGQSLQPGDGKDGAASDFLEEPGKILALLNRHLFQSTQPEKYATLFLAHYLHDGSGTGRLTYSNAGQLPPLLLRGDGSVKRLDCGGTVVGLMDGMSYQQEAVALRDGDLMVAYSDGVTEPENEFGEFGEERMMEVVRMYREEPLHVISAQVLSALDAWIGAEEQPDDITLVLARQRPIGANGGL